MADCQDDYCDDDHGTLESHEHAFIVGQFSAKSILKLSDTEDATYVDCDGGNGDGVWQKAEHGALSEVEELKVQIALSGLASSPGELQAESDEDCQRDNLEGQTSYHDVHTSVGRVCIVLCGSQGSSDGLQQQTEEVASHECDGVELGRESRDAFAKDDDEATEA